MASKTNSKWVYIDVYAGAGYDGDNKKIDLFI